MLFEDETSETTPKKLSDIYNNEPKLRHVKEFLEKYQGDLKMKSK